MIGVRLSFSVYFIIVVIKTEILRKRGLLSGHLLIRLVYMARPPKDERLRKDSDLRIPLTVEQKRLIVEAATLAESDVATWLRPIVLQAASEKVAEAKKTRKKLRKLTPSNEELLKAAKNNPPPPEWFSEDEERPF